MEIRQFKDPAPEFRPDVRWWLAEGLHTDETLKRDLDLLNEEGFGAIEFLAMDDLGADDKLYGWGSEEWTHDSQFLFRETTKRGMGVSTTCGTNWSNCNLITITPDDRAASKELDYVVRELPAGGSFRGRLPECELKMPGVTKQDLIAVVAIRDLGAGEDGKHCLDRTSAVDLTASVRGGSLEYTAPADGTYLLFFFWIHGTGQTAGPSAAVSYTVNYMDHDGIDAFKAYWDSVVITPEMDRIFRENGRGMMYMDSLELSTFTKGGQLWGYTLLDEFRARRGYELAPYLPFVVRRMGMGMDASYHYTCNDPVFFEKLLNDLYQTMTDLYMENMMKPMKEWCNSHGLWLRSEISYGLPFEISQPGKYVDDVETESLEFASQIDSYRGLAGTAHVYDRLYSSETGATMMNYRLPLDFYTQIIYTQFAAGVTKTVLHGYSSIAGSEEATYWPGHEGMWPMFSERFGERQPSCRHYPDWTKMVARYQMMLRAGKPRTDLAILRLDYDFNNALSFTGEKEDVLYGSRRMRAHEGIYWRDMSLQDAGYTWDYFAPQLLEEDHVTFGSNRLLPDGPGYKALIIYQKSMPLESAKKILALAKTGLPVLFVNGCTEEVRTGVFVTHETAASATPFNDGKDAELSGIVAMIKALPNVRELDDQKETLSALRGMGITPAAELAEPNQSILTLTRRDGEKRIVYLYNMMYYTGSEPVPFTVKIEGAGKPYRLSCETGEVEEVACYRIEGDRTVLDLSLMPGEACLFLVDTSVREDHIASVDADQADLRGAVRLFGNGPALLRTESGAERRINVSLPDPVELTGWTLAVESWDEGRKVVLTEDRGLGIVTREVRYDTAKELIEAGEADLIPWKDLEGIGPEVSGVGFYRTAFTLKEALPEGAGAVLSIKNTFRNTAAVYVNGQKAPAFDVSRMETEIGPLLHAGENEILIEVTSTLTNRLRARGYYGQIMERTVKYMMAANNALEAEANGAQEGENPDAGLFPLDFSAPVQDYGMTGNVLIRFWQGV